MIQGLDDAAAVEALVSLCILLVVAFRLRDGDAMTALMRQLAVAVEAFTVSASAEPGPADA